MRKIFSDVLKHQLPLLFTKRFPDFMPYKPKLSVEEKKKYAMPIATDYFRRTRGSLWEIIGIRRYSQDEWTLEILWSIHARFPLSRLFLDGGRVNKEELVAMSEAHTSSRSIIPNGYPTDWPVWECSVPYNHPEFLKRYTVESIQPVEPDIAERKVIEQLISTADMIEKFVLPLFAEVEQRHLS